MTQKEEENIGKTFKENIFGVALCDLPQPLLKGLERLMSRRYYYSVRSLRRPRSSQLK